MESAEGSDEPARRDDDKVPFAFRSPSPSVAKRNSAVSEHEPGTCAVEQRSNDSASDVTHDSMVTVPLSGPPSLAIDTGVISYQQVAAVPASSVRRTVDTIGHARDTETDAEDGRTSSDPGAEGNDDDTPKEETPPRTLEDELQDYESRADELDMREQETPTPPSGGSEDEVNWDELQKTEHEQKDKESDDSTNLLLARLDQENTKLAACPESARVEAKKRETRPPPPSISQLKKMVNGPTPQALRYSMLPPPPMTDLEFFAALVKDYQQTAERLPTLLSNKIRKGIPPPLRGVVWQSMSGARDAGLQEQFDRLSGESSPYEFTISKDLARSFPGVDMFREAGGEGQLMLGRVLKCFSIYDREIGHCQGLAFLVGPLLMHMSDKAAFCVLVRLMEHYDLRSCFQPDLAGLHVRIYQFQELLRHNFPILSAHLDDLRVDPAYVSQWFLSFFAVTCPLPMLFRIYDVLLAEGATETFMRVGLALMRRNEARLLTCVELEDATQILLSRGIWDPYNFDADALVRDITTLTGAVGRERLLQLESGYKESRQAAAAATAHDYSGSAGAPGLVRASAAVDAAASRFLARNLPSAKQQQQQQQQASSTLSPSLGAPSTPVDLLRRSTSKRSLASTLNSMETSSASVASSTSTEATSLSRDSANSNSGGPDNMDSINKMNLMNNMNSNANLQASNNNSNVNSVSRSTAGSGAMDRPGLPRLQSGKNNAGERSLHGQIEDLLTVLSELQRNQALLAGQLKQERDERGEDREVVRSLVDGLVRGGIALSPSPPGAPDVAALLRMTETRFGIRTDAAAGTAGGTDLPTKAQLSEDLAQTKERLEAVTAESQRYARRIYELDQEMSNMKQSLREGQALARSLHQDKQKLEKQMQGLRRTRASGASNHSHEEAERGGGVGGLREFRLGRSGSPPGYGGRTSSLRGGNGLAVPGGGSAGAGAGAASSHEAETLLRELVQAKTAEAVAKEEAEQWRGKLESMRRAYGLAAGGGGEAQGQTPGIMVSAAGAGAAAIGMLGRLTAGDTGTGAAGGGGANGGGGFWGWRR